MSSIGDSIADQQRREPSIAKEVAEAVIDSMVNGPEEDCDIEDALSVPGVLDFIRAKVEIVVAERLENLGRDPL